MAKASPSWFVIRDLLGEPGFEYLAERHSYKNASAKRGDAGSPVFTFHDKPMSAVLRAYAATDAESEVERHDPKLAIKNHVFAGLPGWVCARLEYGWSAFPYYPHLVRAYLHTEDSKNVLILKTANRGPHVKASSKRAWRKFLAAGGKQLLFAFDAWDA